MKGKLVSHISTSKLIKKNLLKISNLKKYQERTYWKLQPETRRPMDSPKKNKKINENYCQLKWIKKEIRFFNGDYLLADYLLAVAGSLPNEWI
jgi:hypothetical protein